MSLEFFILCYELFLLFLPNAVRLFASYFWIYSTILTSVFFGRCCWIIVLIVLGVAYTLHRQTKSLCLKRQILNGVCMWFICIWFCALLFHIFLLESYSDSRKREKNWQILCITSCSECYVFICVKTKEIKKSCTALPTLDIKAIITMTMMTTTMTTTTTIAIVSKPWHQSWIWLFDFFFLEDSQLRCDVKFSLLIKTVCYSKY